jgi:hypothetical protein
MLDVTSLEARCVGEITPYSLARKLRFRMFRVGYNSVLLISVSYNIIYMRKKYLVVLAII